MTSMKLLVASAILLQGALATVQVNLPGAPNVNFKQYSGYYTVGATKNHQLHYMFTESANNPKTDPVLLWLTGGPGCSGLSALFTEWGPLMANADGATLSVNPYSWNNNASVLTLEAPAGVGYSYSTDGKTATSDDQVASENWEALVAFFNEYFQYAGNDFYVTGESYGGIYVPTLFQTILDRQSNFTINLKGMAIGNGCVSGPEGTDSILLFEYAHGMIDEQQWTKVRQQCCNNDTDDCPFHSFNKLDFCSAFVEVASMNAWEGGMNPYNMYANCVNDGVTPLPKRFEFDFKRRTGKDADIKKLSSVPCMNETAVTVYLNRADVRSAMGIPSSVKKWEICSNINYNEQYDDMSSRVKNAVQNGYKVMIYSGDVDMACNFLMGQRFTDKLGFPLTKAKKHYSVNGQIGGFHTQYGNNLHFVTVRGAGHMVPTDKPDVSFYILDNFLNNKPF